MKRVTVKRQALLDDVLMAGRELSTAAVMFHATLAARMGLSATEEKALDYLDRFGPLTPRALVEHSGLAPASVTALIDRLEEKGYARRLPNPDDRRSLLVEINSETVMRGAPLFDEFVENMLEMYTKYSDDELALFAEMFRETARRQAASTVKLQQSDPGAVTPPKQRGGARRRP